VNHATWYAARSAGIVAWVLLAASVLWGLALSTGVLGRRPRRAWLLDLHRFLGAAGIVFTAVHVVAIVADTYVHFGVADVLVPFASAWHPVAVAWGIIGVWLVAVVEATSLLRNRVPERLWRAVHYLSFPVFVLVTVHGLAAGTDTRNFFGLWVTFTALAMIGPLVWKRLNGERAKGVSIEERISVGARARTRAVPSSSRPLPDGRGVTSSATAPRSAR
jgi:hypothetical protein